jgi:hypothetical protein
VERIRKGLPAGVYLSSFSGTHTIPVVVSGASTSAAVPAGGATVPAAAGTPVTPAVNPNDLCAGLSAPAGTVAISGSAGDLPAVSLLVDSLRQDTDLTVLWVSTVKSKSDHGVDFTLSASLGTTARGHRLESFFKGTPCK